MRDAIGLGHRKILVVIRRAASGDSMRESIAARIEHLLGEELTGERSTVTVLAREKPTLVIADSVFEAVSLHDYCLQNGIRMPQDLSMVVMEDTPILEWMNPPPTRYRFPNEKVLRHFPQWFQSGFPNGLVKDIPEELVGGKTLGKAEVD